MIGAPSTIAFGLSLLLQAATPDSNTGGWVKPEATDLTRVLGVRFKAQVGEPAFLVMHPEEWTAPYLSQDGGRLYSGTTSGVVEARSVETGEVLWSKKDLGSIGGSMAEHKGALIVGSGSWLLALDDKTGKEKWRYDLAGAIGGRITVRGSLAIIPVRPNAFSAIDLEKGDQVWRTKRPTPDGITMRGEAPVAIDSARSRVYLGFSDGTLMAAGLTNGESAWTASIGKVGAAFADVDAEPIVVDGGRSVIAASYSGGLVKVDATNGRTLWRKELLKITGLTRAGSEGLLIASVGDGQVLGISPDSGNVRWRFRFLHGTPTDPISIGRGLAVVGNAKGPLAVLDVSNGRPLQVLQAGSGASAPLAWRDPDLALLSNKGLILALRYGGGRGISP